MTAIRLYPDPHLSRVSAPVSVFGRPVETLAMRLLEAMYLGGGRGFAAPQLAQETADARMFVMDAGWKEFGRQVPTVFVNPEIVWESKETAVMEEACLSIPDRARRVRRPSEIEVCWQSTDGSPQRAKFTGVEAVIVQHELDHLDGILILDRPEA